MSDEGFRKDGRIRRRRDYLTVQRRGEKIHLPNLIVFVRRGSRGRRVGITVSSRVGGAVCRNQVKRRLREAWRRRQARFPCGWDIVLVAKRSAADAQYRALLRQIEQLGRRLSREIGREHGAR